MSSSNKVGWFVFVFLAVSVGLYPLIYWITEGKMGLLHSKTGVLLGNTLWNTVFHINLLFGGIALLVGWTQFSKKLKKERPGIYRDLGKVYLLSVPISGLCAVYLAFFSTGGWISSLGFIVLGLTWLYTTAKAYSANKKKDVSLFYGMMIYSYAACYAAVTLRFWLPVLLATIGNFPVVYKTVAWLCWVPNMLFAYFWVRRKGLQLG